jgi:hypothetical protein
MLEDVSRLGLALFGGTIVASGVGIFARLTGTNALFPYGVSAVVVTVGIGLVILYVAASSTGWNDDGAGSDDA